MTGALPSHVLVRFGVFELDTDSRELRKQGVKIRLQEQPFQILQALLEHPGRVVTREELQQRIWPSDTFVDFDRGLYNAIKRLREALGDSAENPRFIETLSRRGYRFIAAVNGNGSDAATEVLPRTAATPAASHKLRVSIALIGVVAVLLVAAVGVRKFWPHSSTQSTIPQIRSIAVLPLQNLSADPTQEYFSDGMTDALITDLAQIGSLKVISRTSSMQYKQTKKSLSEIARELNVDGIIEGSVQRSGNRVFVTAQLLHGPTDKHLWANSYERDMQDVFLLERDVAEDIARQVQGRITEDQRPSASLRPVNPKVLEAYLQGNYYRSRLGRGSGDEAARTAAAYFQQAIDTDPSFAPAYLGLAWAHFYLLWPSRQDAEIAREAVERALALDPSSSDAHGMLAALKRQAWDWAGAEQEYRRTIAINPNDSGAREEFGHLLEVTGRQDEGWREQQIAQELDPDKDHLSEGLALRRQYDRLIAQLEMMLKRDPDNGYCRYTLYRVYLKKGMYREAIQQLERTLILFGYPQEAAQVRAAFAVSGHDAAIREFAKALEHLMASSHAFLPVNIAANYAILGDKERAFYWLEQAYARHDMGRSSMDIEMYSLKTEFVFDPIRSDPRFNDLLRRIGLPP